MHTQIEQKNIVLCSDGTGQSGGSGNNTNVWRIYDAVDIKHEKIKQLTFYDDGVGTNKNIVMKTLGLVFGFGLSKNIRELYKYTVMHYKPDDKLYLFGFSRGSHTIRLLAELICTFGILNPKSFDNESELDKAIHELQKEFKSAIRWAWIKNIFTSSTHDTEDKQRQRTDSSLAINTQKYTKNLDSLVKKQSVKSSQQDIYTDVEIEFIGVWDTVSAMGMPIDEMRNNLFFAHHAFVDHKLNTSVKRACHALAIDEKRHTFKPELWDQSDEKDKTRIEQMWFSGVHTNVGGGYAKDQLALVSLEWMMTEANKVGLEFRESKRIEIAQKSNHNGTLYDSRSGFAAFHRYKPRDILALTEKFFPNKKSGPNIHVSVFQRIKDSSAKYSPVNLPIHNSVKTTDYQNFDNLPDKTQKTQQYCIEQMQKQQTELSHNNTEIMTPLNNPWNVIWWQKILHLSLVTFFIAFLAIGYKLTQLNPSVEVVSNQNTIKAIQKIVVFVNETNPLYITNKILPGYANNWKIFILMFGVFIVLMLMRKALKKHHDNIGNMLWSVPPFADNRVNAKRLKTNFLVKFGMYIADFFRNRVVLNRNILPSITIKVLPIVMTVIFSGLILAVILYFFTS